MARWMEDFNSRSLGERDQILGRLPALGEGLARAVLDGAIAWEGDPSADIFQLVDGTLRHCCVLLDGRRMIAGFDVLWLRAQAAEMKGWLAAPPAAR